MESKLFHPSIDWSHALPDSLRWIAMAWMISAVAVLAVLVVLRASTRWGRQFWEISGAYFTGRSSIRVWVMLAVMLLSVIIGVRLTVLFSYQGNDMFSSLQTAFEGAAAHDEDVKQYTAFGCRSRSSA